MKGYFVEHKKSNANSDLAANDKVQDQIVKKDVKNLSIVKNKISLTNKVEAFALKTSKTIAAVINTKIKRNKHAHSQLKSNGHISDMNLTREENMTHHQIKQHTFHGVAEKTEEAEAGVVGAALSLMWIVIVIILVAYIIGLLTISDLASAGWIHILGVLALILLILWLLRVI